MIIDMHTHLAANGGVSDSYASFLHQMDVAGIDCAINSDLGDWSDFPTEDNILRANDRACDLSTFSQGRIYWLCYLNPQNPGWQSELDRSASRGAIGIKLWISLKDKLGHLENAIKVLKEAARQKLPVLIHAFNRTDDMRDGEINFHDFCELAKKVPECIMIGAHAGCNWRESLGLLDEFPENAYVDFSGGYPETGIVELLVKHLGADRILFGSDGLGRSFISQLLKVQLADLSDGEREKILWKNAERIFKIRCKNTSKSFGQRLFKDCFLPNEDHCCFCGRWPFWKGLDRTVLEVEHALTRGDYEFGFCVSLDCVFRQDLLNANAEFLEECQETRRVKPLATINPFSANVYKLIEKVKSKNFAGIILHPYLHGWNVADKHLDTFFFKVAQAKLKVWLNVSFADHRFRHVSLAARPVLGDELATMIENYENIEWVLQGVGPEHETSLYNRVREKNFFMTISRFSDFTFGLDMIKKHWGTGCLLWGSEYPFRDIRQVKLAASQQLVDII